MTTPTDRVRAALECITEEHQYIHGQGSFLKLQAKVEEIKRELEGMVLVPVEPTSKMVLAGYKEVSDINEDVAPIYRAMIAPYVGEKK